MTIKLSYFLSSARSKMPFIGMSRIMTLANFSLRRTRRLIITNDSEDNVCS